MRTRAAPTMTELIELVYELLDAHDDTAGLVTGGDRTRPLAWAAHLDYLRALQRKGREILARASPER